MFNIFDMDEVDNRAIIKNSFSAIDILNLLLSIIELNEYRISLNVTADGTYEFYINGQRYAILPADSLVMKSE